VEQRASQLAPVFFDNLIAHSCGLNSKVHRVSCTGFKAAPDHACTCCQSVDNTRGCKSSERWASCRQNQLKRQIQQLDLRKAGALIRSHIFPRTPRFDLWVASVAWDAHRG
jgi:hypothetical protein